MTREAARLVAAEVVALLRAEGALPAAPVALPARLSRKAAARVVGCDARTFEARYVARGFIAAGADKKFARREVLRLRDEGK